MEEVKFKVLSKEDKEKIIEPLDGQKSDVAIPVAVKCDLSLDDFIVKKDGE